MNVRHDMVTVFVARPGAGGRSHEFLQLQRSAGDYMGGTWQTVRGVIEPGETATQAALRELSEEAGLKPVELYGLSSIDSFYAARFDTVWHCAAFFALVAADANVTLNDEHDDFRWVGLDHVTEAFMWSREHELIVEIVGQILGNGLAKPHLLIKL